MAEMEARISELKAYLMKYFENPKEEKILYAFKKLDRTNITLDLLQSTGIGKTVNSFRKHEGAIGKKARELVAKWKQLVNTVPTPAPEDSPPDNANGATTRQPGLQCETVSETTYGSHSGRLTHRLDDVLKVPYLDGAAKVKEEPSDNKALKIKSEKPSKSSSVEEKHHSSEKAHRSHSSQSEKGRDKSHSGAKDKERKRGRTEDGAEEKVRKKFKPDVENHNAISDVAQVKVKKERIESGENQVKIKSEKLETLDGTVVKQEKDSSSSKSASNSSGEKNKHSESHSSKSHKHSKKHHEHRTDDRQKHEKHRTTEKEKSKKSVVTESNSDSNDKHNSVKVKSEPIDKVKTVSDPDGHVKVKTEPQEKVKVKSEPSESSKKHEKQKDSSSSKHRSSSKHSKSGSSHGDKSSSKSVDKSSSKTGSNGSSRDKHKDKSKSHHSSSKHSSSHSKSVEKKKKNVEEFDMFSMPNGNDDDEDDGDDFEDAEAVKMKTEPKEKKKNFTVHASSSSSSKSGGLRTEPTRSLLSPPPIPEHSGVSEDDILSSLPKPSPNYKPLPYLDLDTLAKNAEKRATDTEIAFKKNCRTQVYSGRRNKFLTAVPSLYDSCIQVLKDNVDALDFVGGVPYDIMKPVLEICTPAQLYNIEDVNPQFIGETDELWKNHCTKDFRKDKPEQFESWREMFIRCHDARDAKLKNLTKSISASIAKAKEPVRTTKLAYLDVAAKPPREVRRKQRIHGTAGPVKIDPLHKLTSHGASASRPHKFNPLRRADPNISTSLKRNRDDRTPRVIPPMMKKTLKFMRHLKRK